MSTLRITDERAAELARRDATAAYPADYIVARSALGPLLADRADLLAALRECVEAISYLRGYVADRGLSAEDDADAALACAAALGVVPEGLP